MEAVKEQKYKWNTVLDKCTCIICSELHGRILTEKEIQKTRPPLHGRDINHFTPCRCYLTKVG